MGTKNIARIQILEDGRVPAKEAKRLEDRRKEEGLPHGSSRYAAGSSNVATTNRIVRRYSFFCAPRGRTVSIRVQSHALSSIFFARLQSSGCTRDDRMAIQTRNSGIGAKPDPLEPFLQKAQ